MARVFHKDSRVFSNFQPTELVKLCGVAQGAWPVYATKELLDNAVAALEEHGIANPSVELELKRGSLIVWENGPGIPDDILEQVLDFDAFGGSSRHHKLPTRGAQGNALMTIVGIATAWGSHVVVHRPAAPSLKIVIALDEVRQTIDIIQEQLNDGVPAKRSGIEVGLPALPWKRGGSEFSDMRDVAKTFSWMNPHVSFLLKDRTKGFEVWPCPRGHNNPAWKNVKCGAAGWFTNDEFGDRLAADIRSRPEMKQALWLREFAGFNNKNVFDAFKGTIGDIKTADLKATAKKLKDYAITQAGSVLAEEKFGAVGEERLGAFLEWMGADPSARLEYSYSTGTFSREAGNQVPYLVEVALLQLPDGVKQAPAPVLCMNRTVLYGSPTFANLKWREKVRGQWRQLGGDLGSLMRAYEVDHGKTPAAVVVHVTCPSPGYAGYGKQTFDTTWLCEPLSACMERVTLEVRKQRAGEARRTRSTGEDQGTIRDTLFGLIPGVWEQDTENGKLPIMLRQLYYGVRKVWHLHHDKDLQYATYCAYLDEYEQAIGKSICLRDPRGTLIEPHSGKELRLGTDAVNRYEPKKWEGHTIIYSEKEQFSHILKAYGVAKRYDAILIGSKGFAVESCREVLQKYKKLLGSLVKIICIHDADPAGYMIGHDLATNLPRFGDNVDVQVIDVGLTIEEAEDMRLQDEPFELKKSVWSMVNNMRKIVVKEPDGRRRPLLGPLAWEYFMPSMLRGSSYPDWVHDPRGKRVELNAMPPRVFIEWLEGHLDRNDCRKVHPPDEVVTEHLMNARTNMVKNEVGKHLMRILGDDAVHQILGEIGVPSFDLAAVLEMKPEQSWAYLTERAGQTGVDVGPIIERVLAKRLNGSVHQ